MKNIKKIKINLNGKTFFTAVWAATAAGDPGYGQAAFIISGIAGHLYLRKLKLKKYFLELPFRYNKLMLP